jgi:hypothetical protein
MKEKEEETGDKAGRGKRLSFFKGAHHYCVDFWAFCYSKIKHGGDRG